MYVFGGNDVNRTFSDLWKISLKDIVDCARRQWYIENQENNNKDESDYRYNFSEDIVTSSPRWPYKYPRWQCICRSSHLVGKFLLIENSTVQNTTEQNRTEQNRTEERIKIHLISLLLIARQQQLISLILLTILR